MVSPAIAEFSVIRAAELDRRVAELEAALRNAADALERAEFFEAAAAARDAASRNGPAPAAEHVTFRSGLMPLGCQKLLDALRADHVHCHDHACQELLDLLARRGKAGLE